MLLIGFCVVAGLAPATERTRCLFTQKCLIGHHRLIERPLIPMNKQEIKRLITNNENIVYTPDYKKEGTHYIPCSSNVCLKWIYKCL